MRTQPKMPDSFFAKILLLEKGGGGRKKEGGRGEKGMMETIERHVSSFST